MPLKVSDIVIDAIPDPANDGDDSCHWVCSICRRQLEVDWRGVETRPVAHTLEYCLKYLFELVAV